MKTKNFVITIILSFFLVMVILINIQNINTHKIQIIQDNHHEHQDDTKPERIHHEAALMIVINGSKLDFSDPSLQQVDRKIHFEYDDGLTICRESENTSLGYLFETLHMQLTDECFILDNKTKYCSSDDYSLRFFLNRQEVTNLSNYNIKSNDRILIFYGNEYDELIPYFFDELNNHTIRYP